VLSEELGLPARFIPTGALEAAPPSGALGDALIVFSQGLSPNARLAFSHSAAWGSVVLVTAQGLSATQGERFEWYTALVDAGVSVVPFAAPDEYGSLVRMAGPMLGYAAALALADSLGQLMSREVSCDFEAAAERVERADAALALLLADHGMGESDLRALVEGEVALVASEGYGELLQNLKTKWMEITLGPFPPLWDAAEFAHGGLQRLWAAGSATVVQLSRGRPADQELGRALAEATDSEKARVFELRADDLGAASVFEHEALVNALLLCWLRAAEGDPSSWPGKGQDAPLYERGPALGLAARVNSQRALAPSPQLALATWPGRRNAETARRFAGHRGVGPRLY
jgi:creatinine amidohydrolase